MDAASQTPALELVTEHAEYSAPTEHESATDFLDARFAALPALPVTPATTSYARPTNPFAEAAFFLNDDYAHNVESMVQAAPAEAPKLETVRRYATGLWIDSIARIEHVTPWLDAAEAQARELGKPVVPVFVLYDLPDRNCASKASTGELSVEQGGERRYREEFVDVLSGLFAQRPNQRAVVILEPDSLANLATNLSVEKCARDSAIYMHSVAYAVSKLSLPNVHVYLDAAHAGWMGWESNRERMAQIFAHVLELAGGAYRIRGFATNVANYNALTGDFGKQLEPSTPCANELSYVEKLRQSLAKVGIHNKGFIVDTGRNGVPEVRARWVHWCNLQQAGLGERPRAQPAPGIDAYFWVKPPGESDGYSDPTAPGFDAFCRSPDSAANAPAAGAWFGAHFLSLVRNANPPL